MLQMKVFIHCHYKGYRLLKQKKREERKKRETRKSKIKGKTEEQNDTENCLEMDDFYFIHQSFCKNITV